MSIGERIKAARKQLKLNQTEFGERCGVVLKTQSRFERDEFMPGSDYLLALDAMGIDAGYILTGRPAATDLAEQTLLHAFRAASDDLRNAALQVLRVAGTTASSKTAEKATRVKARKIAQYVEGNVTQHAVIDKRKGST